MLSSLVETRSYKPLCLDSLDFFEWFSDVGHQSSIRKPCHCLLHQIQELPDLDPSISCFHFAVFSVREKLRLQLKLFLIFCYETVDS